MRISAPLLVGAAAALAATTLSAQGTDALKLYGSATAGTAGKSPAIWALSTPWLGNSGFGLSIENGKPNAGAVAFFSQKRVNTTFGGVNIYVDFASALQLPFVKLDANGAASYKLPLPNLSMLLGQTGYAQAFIADSGGAAAGFSATEGLAGTVQNFGMLLATRSSSDTNDRQIAIHLGTGKQSVVSNSNLRNGNVPSFYPKGGSHCLIPGSLSKNVSLWDCRVHPPKYVKSITAQTTPWAVTYNPDGLRAYIVNQSSAKGTAPEVQVVWGAPTATNFGTAFPGGNIKLGKYIDMWQMEFTSDGNIGLIASFGFVSPATELRKYDTKLGSSTYNKQIASPLRLSGYIFGLTRITDKLCAVATAGLGGQISIQLVDIKTMKVTKTVGPTQFGSVIWGMKADARGKYLYVANVPNVKKKVLAGVVRVDVDPSSANYGKTVRIATGISATWNCYNTTTSPAGDRLYAVAGTGFNNSFVGSILEYDTKTLKLLRTFKANGLGNIYNLRVR